MANNTNDRNEKRTLLSDPPDSVQIFGIDEGHQIIAGQELTLSCMAAGGNPLASLTWYKGDRQVLPFDLYCFSTKYILVTNNTGGGPFICLFWVFGKFWSTCDGP